MECVKLPVFLLTLYVINKCMCMTLHELEDFSNFLKKTSSLDQTLKKDPHDDEEDEDAISDHAWEESGKFEGDLILNDRQRRLIVQDVAEGLSRNGLNDITKRWPNNEVIFYIQREHFTSDQVDAILSGINDLAENSCIKFRPYRRGDKDAVVIQGGRRGCFSAVGYQGGYQIINLSARHPVGRGCFRHGTVIHELLHTLGFYHMQSSSDRDDYIDILWENVIERAKHNFRKYNAFAVTDFGIGYDYDSVLHYSRGAFSKNRQPTIVPKQGGAQIGQRIGLSDKDTKKLNKMYCDADSDNADSPEEVQKGKPKKKKSKNQPFQGHGIGYHQGKTVVIKLPAAETYKLIDLPSYHMFDYFSKTPQAVSTSLIEGAGIGKEIVYKSPEDTILNTPVIHVPSSDKNKDSKINFNAESTTKKPEKKDTRDINIEQQSIHKIADPNQDIPLKDLNDPFHRLEGIIKTHVYPSQDTNFDAYKADTIYNKFRNPDIKYEPERHSKNVDELFSKKRTELTQDKTAQNHKDLLKFGEINDDSFGTKLKMPTQISPSAVIIPNYTYDDFKNRNNYNDFVNSTKQSDTDNPHILSQLNLSLNSDPDEVYKSQDLKIFTTDEIIQSDQEHKTKQKVTLPGHNIPIPNYTYEQLKNRHDFSNLYNADIKDKDENPKRQLYTLFGYSVPLKNDWYNIESPLSTKSYSADVIEKADHAEGEVTTNTNLESDRNSQYSEFPENEKQIANSGYLENYNNDRFTESPTKAVQSKEESENDSNKKSASYKVTEIQDENNGSSIEHTDTATAKSASNEYKYDDDYFKGSIDDRLASILKEYNVYDDYNIGRPSYYYDDSDEDTGSDESDESD